MSTIPSVIPGTPPLCMPGLFLTLVPYEIPRVSPYPGPAPSSLPTQLTSKYPPDKTIPDPSSTPVLFLPEAPNVIPNTSPSGIHLVPTSVPYEKPSVSSSPGPTPSKFPSQANSKDPPDKTEPSSS